jgi:hypothetical protein
MAEQDEQEGEVKQVAARKRMAIPKPPAGATTAVPWVIAVAGLALAGYMFMQLSALQKKLAQDNGPVPRGSPEAGAVPVTPEGEGWDIEAKDVVYDLGKFVSNTSDGRHAQLDIALIFDSEYRTGEWAAYQHQMDLYQQALDQYWKMQAGEIGPDGKPVKKGKGEGASVSGLFILAAGGEGAAAPAMPTQPPEEPVKPMTKMERKLREDSALVRDIVISQINAYAAADLISPAGREGFKKAVIDALSAKIEPHFGTIKDLLFNDFVTT